MRRLLLALLLGAAPLSAQSAPAPANWQWRLDASSPLVNGTRTPPGDSGWLFVDMAPGWHVTMGPGGFLFDPANVAGGRFAVEAEMIAFPSSTNEPFGVFIGGHEEATGASVTSFLVRRDGRFAVVTVRDDQRTMVSEWAASEALKPLAANGSVRTTLRVLAEPDSVHFYVDGVRLGAWPRGAMSVEGVYGFRIGRGVNLHITNLDHTRRHAPYPSRR
jgi:hypothetical protein